MRLTRTLYAQQWTSSLASPFNCLILGLGSMSPQLRTCDEQLRRPQQDRANRLGQGVVPRSERVAPACVERLWFT